MNKRKYEFALELSHEMHNTRFSKVSISDICDSMKCSRQSFYYYFKTLNDCLAYYVRESFKNQIKEEYLISDIFNYFDNNARFVQICNDDPAAKSIFWDGLFIYAKKMLDFVFAKNIVEYLALYSEQKDAIASFYVAGLLEVAKMYSTSTLPSKEKCISYCKSVIGSGEDTRAMIMRFTR